MSSEKYNGWTNRETWALFTHLTSDEALYQAHRGLSAVDLQADIEQYASYVAIGQPMSYAIGQMIVDVGSLWRVNWRAVAEAIADE